MLTIAKIMWARALVLGSLTMQECSSLKPGEATGWDQLSQPLKSFNGDLYVEVTMGGNTGKKYAESGKREVRKANWKSSGNWEKNKYTTLHKFIF